MNKLYFNNHQLKFDIDKIKSYDNVELSKDYDDDLDIPYTIQVNDTTYFYHNELERDNDYGVLLDNFQ